MLSIFRKKSRYTIISDRGTFDCKEGESILDAANRNKIIIPHQCGMGACKSCETLIDGKNHLACQHQPKKNCEISFSKKLIRSEIISVREIKDKVFEVCISNTVDADNCEGQHINVAAYDSAASTRKYSIVKSSRDSIVMHIRSHDNGEVSSKITQSKEGDAVYISSPSGTFTLKSGLENYDHCFGIANGSGMGVTMSLVEKFLSERESNKATLVSITREKQPSDYHKVIFEEIEKNHKGRIKIISGRVEDISRNKDITQREKSLYLVCGSNIVNNSFSSISDDISNFRSKLIQESFA